MKSIFPLLMLNFLLVFSACEPKTVQQTQEVKDRQIEFVPEHDADLNPQQQGDTLQQEEQKQGILPKGLTIKQSLRYDLSKPMVYKMPTILDEISGISFLNEKKDTLYAVQDEVGQLFSFPLNNAIKEKAISFSQKGDFEDIAFYKDKAFALKSNGSIMSIPLSIFKTGKQDNVLEIKDLLPEGEYEGLYADETTQSIYALCKECKEAKKNKQAIGYILKMEMDGKINFNSFFTIDVKAIEAKTNIKKNNFLPSALAKNKKTNEWYILSAHNSVLVVTDLNWTVKQAYHLPEDIFEQPEGIAFDSQNNLYISNEKGKAKQGNVLKFSYQK
jgi:uncharacterized protein YjiK